MGQLSEYQSYATNENTVKNLVSLVMVLFSLVLFITYTIVPTSFAGLSQHTLRIIVLSFGILMFVGGVYVRFIQVTEYQTEY